MRVCYLASGIAIMQCRWSRMHTNHVARGILHAILNRQHVARSPQHSERTLLHAARSKSTMVENS